MDPRQITEDFTVAPQISLADLAAIKAAGFASVLCNRPDEEVEPALSSQAFAAACAELGLEFNYLPYYPGALTQDLVEGFATLLPALPKPVFAYCRSGTRCSHLWSLAEAGQRPLDEILSRAAAAGYDNSGLAALIEARAAQL